MVADPGERATTLAAENGFYPVATTSGLKSYLRRGSEANKLTIYIEGDGAKWPHGRPPRDPTPVNPLALKLAIADAKQNHANVAYVARPCQFLSSTELAECSPSLWTDARFGTEAISATNHAIDALRRQTQATTVNLVGYSGGGALAILLAAQRDDISCLVTVAAPLDTDAWAAAHRVSPLSKSLNPALTSTRYRALMQTHFQGLDDRIVPTATTYSYRQNHPHADFEPVAGYDHECCWETSWATRVAQVCR